MEIRDDLTLDKNDKEKEKNKEKFIICKNRLELEEDLENDKDKYKDNDIKELESRIKNVEPKDEYIKSNDYNLEEIHKLYLKR